MTRIKPGVMYTWLDWAGLIELWITYFPVIVKANQNEPEHFPKALINEQGNSADDHST